MLNVWGVNGGSNPGQHIRCILISTDRSGDQPSPDMFVLKEHRERKRKNYIDFLSSCVTCLPHTQICLTWEPSAPSKTTLKNTRGNILYFFNFLIIPWKLKQAVDWFSNKLWLWGRTFLISPSHRASIFSRNYYKHSRVQGYAWDSVKLISAGQHVKFTIYFILA